MVLNAMSYVILLLVVCLFLGSLLSLSSYPHWFIRAWDFPRIQIVVIAVGLSVLHFVFSRIWENAPTWLSWTVYALTLILIVWHGFRIAVYSPLVQTQAKSVEPEQPDSAGRKENQIRILVSNLELENDKYELWRKTVLAADPDVLVVLEPGERWVKEIEPLFEEYSEQIIYPQENWYGMMLLSRLPVEEQQIRFLVQDDVPSIDTKLQLKSGQTIRLIGVHPRPPEPVRNNDATARDAELMLWGKELKEEQGPVIICGDLNDVAWSRSTRLFLRTSGLLDPRIGRGLFNTFHADHWWMRFPLDHIFHSNHFSVVQIQRLPFVGSDHFPIFIDLEFSPEKKEEHEVMKKEAGDEEEAEERIERAQEENNLQPQSVEDNN